MPALPRAIRVTPGAVSALAVVLAVAPGGSSAQIPDEFTNLQVLPQDIEGRQLIGVMRSFAMGLGVRCTNCHVGEEGRPFSEFDFASDEKEMKRKARFMLRMTMALNDEVLPGLTEVATRAEPPVRVQCVTCHRGVATPRQIGDEIAIVVEREGGDAGVARYRELREEYYGSGAYDFGEQPLIELGGRVAGDRPEAALQIYALALEYFPESVQALVGTAQVHIQLEDTDAARAALLRARELAPDQPQIQRMLDRLGGGAR